MRGISVEIKIALIQMKSNPTPSKNLEKAMRQVEKAAKAGAKIVCLQELFRTEYFCQTENRQSFDLAETIPGPTTEALRLLAKRCGVVLIAPVFEKRVRGLYHNSVVVLGVDGKMLGSYRKMHIPEDPNFYEKYYFSPGDLGFPVFKTPFGKIAVLICWDQWYPEAARVAAIKGAQIIFYPTAIGWVRGEKPKASRLQRQAWKTVQVSHAVTNGVYVACVNRVGREKKIKFWGSSFVAGPDGEVLSQASLNREGILFAQCDLSKIQRTRKEWPFFRDRRIDAYQPLVSHFSEK
jgi:N-carbamoylputrescine amidase